MEATKEDNKGLYGYLFHYNDYTGLWAAFKSSEQHRYAKGKHPSKQTEGKVIYSNDIGELILRVQAGELNNSTEKTVYEEYGLKEPKANEI